MENMETVWQQAELNAGLADDLSRTTRVLRENLRGDAPEIKASSATDVPDRPGLLGLLDATARMLRASRDNIESARQLIGERGQAPVAAGATRDWSSTARQVETHPARLDTR